MSGLAGTRTEEVFHTGTKGRQVHKYSNYFSIYDRYLEKYKGKSPRVLEIGVQHGGSLLMWDAYFSGEATIIGVDILPECKKFEAANVRIFVGDQSDESFLTRIIAEIGKVDVIIDDGSHIPAHQIKSFEYLFYDGLTDDGIYICEDCHTSYWPRYGGGLRRRGTFIEYSKRLCDQLNAFVAADSALIVDRATRWIRSVTFFSSVVVFEKGSMTPPTLVGAGEVAIDLESPFRQSRFAKIILPLKRSLLIQSLVRRNPHLWRLMRRLLNEGPR